MRVAAGVGLRTQSGLLAADAQGGLHVDQPHHQQPLHLAVFLSTDKEVVPGSGRIGATSGNDDHFSLVQCDFEFLPEQFVNLLGRLEFPTGLAGFMPQTVLSEVNFGLEFQPGPSGLMPTGSQPKDTPRVLEVADLGRRIAFRSFD